MIRLTKHAQEAIGTRNIAPAWIEATVKSPDFVDADPRHRKRSDPIRRLPKMAAGSAGCASSRGRRYRDYYRAFRSRGSTMIRTSYDPEADAMFIWFGPEGLKSAGTEEVSPGILLDFDNEGRVIGIEVLDVSARMTRSKVAA